MESSSPTAAAAAAPPSSHDEDNLEDHDRRMITTVQSQAPSHILQDGRFVFLPPPSALEQRKFVAHSITRHGLLQQDMMMDDTMKKNQDEEDGEEENDSEQKKSTPNKIHPLALASARLENEGINELNRAINLSALVQTGEYFGMSNVVADASLDLTAKSSSDDIISSDQQQQQQQQGEQSKSQADTDKASDNSSTTSSNEPPSANASATGTTGAAKDMTTGDASAVDAAGDGSSSSVVVTAEMQQAQRVRAVYVLKRKHAQFRRASSILARHRDRLKSATVAERRPLRRFGQLRQQHWRLVAPEHGVRALPHPARPTETLSCDVDVYLQQQQHSHDGGTGGTLNTAGRLARRVPRYATIELKKDYSVETDLKTWKDSRQWIKESQKDDDEDDDDASKSSNSSSDGDRKKDVEMKDANDDDDSQKAKAQSTDNDNKEEQEGGQEEETWTRAEPFAIADPTLGKLDADFDPSKVAMLTLQFKIEASTTSTSTTSGRRRSVQACLEPFAAAAAAGTDSKTSEQGQDPSSFLKYQEDEKVLVALQHSLFCAKLFESIRREIAADTEELGANTTGSTTAAASTSSTGASKGAAASSFSSAVWLSSDGQGTSNFLPAPHLMIRGGGGNGGEDDDDLVNSKVCQPLAVIHCHEGEVMVQLDCEYTLRIKLVEAGSEHDNDNDDDDDNNNMETTNGGGPASTSSAPATDHLMLLCRALLLHAQETYHHHSLHQEEKQRKLAEEGDDSSKKINISMMHNRKDGTTAAVHLRKVETASPRILQSCVSLGSKMLLERRIRATLVKVKAWLTRRLKSQPNNNNTNGNDSDWNTLQVEWLSLSILDQHAQFTVLFRSWHVDVHLAGDRITVTHFASAGIGDTTLDSPCYRKVDFYSDIEFELFLRNSLKQQL